MKVEEEYQDVLQTFELIIVGCRDRNPTLTDYSVSRVYEALIHHYSAARNHNPPPPWQGTPVEQALVLRGIEIGDWWLTNSKVPDSRHCLMRMERATPITHEVLILALKRLFKSVQKWSKSGGRQGYLNFVSQFIPPHIRLPE